jgi:glycine oxidase
MGCALALELAERGLDVVVLERSIPGAEASSAAGGILGAQAEAPGPGAFLELALASRALWRELAPRLGEVGYRDSGLLKVAFDEADLVWLEGIASWNEGLGLRCQRLDAHEVAELQPGLSSQVQAGLYFPEDGVVDAQLLPSALAGLARRAGARIVNGGEVRGLVREGRRVIGLETSKGGVLADRVVICAGAWTAQVLPRASVEPVRGQILVLRGQPGQLGPVTFSHRGYMVPRSDGRILVGSTMERVGFREEVTLGGMHRVSGIAMQLMPGLSDARIVDYWAGFRPGTPDDLPLIGPSGREGVEVMSGHFRNGILLTPISARLMAQRLCGERTDLSLAPFDPRRFA